MDMKRCQILFIMTLMTLLMPISIGAAVQSNWYSVEFFQEQDTADYSWDITEENIDVPIGHFTVEASDLYADPQWEGNLQFKIISLIGTFDFLQMVNDNNEPYMVPFTIRVRKGQTIVTEYVDLAPGSHYVDIPLTLLEGETADFSISFDATPHPGRPVPRRGTYYTALRFELYVDEMGEDWVHIGQDAFNLTSYYIEPQPGQGNTPTILTDLLVDRYSSADQIDIPTLQMTQGSLVIGNVSFFSNDDSNATYRIRISPDTKTYPYFAFYKVSNPNVIVPYKVVIPSENTIGSHSGEFDVLVTNMDPYWQKSFELAITQMNYDDLSFSVGEYTSVISIELLRE
jgi:hypothetical protein